MDSPPSNNLSIEGTQTLSAMTINSQALQSDSNSSEYYPWTYQNPCFPGFQGAAFCYQSEGAQVVPIAMTTTQPGDLTAPHLQYASPIFTQAVPQGGVPRKQSERSLMKNREAAREYRRRKKVYIQDLEKRAEKLETENMALKEELKTWKMGQQKFQ
ncbi:cAMP-responsive element modulator-like isoform X2 [Hippocampus comes]|uniref:cAMP-responsive element modulator-like isoform X1 n=2 Tax=Hippocampus comes TaxID=109280 RepID=UPI00094ECE73|nr:PREDICTED: cAMP-responsive element modulator-like isoform X1 [Hippocampus comes]XP_019713047.1 PREDICTED: cAMP-responsive element modulator-like isoform X2 [Hippocampus comes]